MGEQTTVVTREESITSIIESVALEQKALSTILTAEGAKITKVVEKAKTTDEMIEVNKSVQNMVNAITRLEMVLHSKLELFTDCIEQYCAD